MAITEDQNRTCWPVDTVCYKCNSLLQVRKQENHIIPIIPCHPPPLQASQNPGFKTNLFPSKTNLLNFSWKHADRVHTPGIEPSRQGEHGGQRSVNETDDECSPRYMVAEDLVIRECQQAVHAFDIAPDMVRRMEVQETDSDGEPTKQKKEGTIGICMLSWIMCPTPGPGMTFVFRWWWWSARSWPTYRWRMKKNPKMKLHQTRKFLKRRNTDTCFGRSMAFLMKNSGSNFLMRIWWEVYGEWPHEAPPMDFR